MKKEKEPLIAPIEGNPVDDSNPNDRSLSAWAEVIGKMRTTKKERRRNDMVAAQFFGPCSPVKIIPPSVTYYHKDYLKLLESIEDSGRTCYKSEGKIQKGSAESFVRKLIKRKHESVLEHESLKVRVVCDRGVSHELVRHRHSSFDGPLEWNPGISQESTRYCTYTGKLEAIEPDWDLHLENHPNRPEIERIWKEAMEQSASNYDRLLSLGASPSLGRSVLPISLKTEVVLTANLREWRHILNIRNSQGVHPDMITIMRQILKEFKTVYPLFFEDIHPDKEKK